MADSLFKILRVGKKIEIKNQDRVKLPVILGIKPQHYLDVLYAAAIFLILFFALVLPGLVKPGSAGIFISQPRGAAVRIDDITLGYTPCTIFIPDGKHTVEFVLPGFNADRHTVDVNGRVFGSLFFPSKVTIAGNLVCPDPAEALAHSALEYMYWAAAGEPTESFQNPMILSEGVYRVGPAAKDPALRKAMQGILDVSLCHTVTRSSARDLLRAQFLLDNNGLSPSTITAVSSLRRMVLQIGNNSESSAWLAELLPRETAEKLTQSAWFTNNAGSLSRTDSNNISLQLPSSLNLEEVSFTSVSPGYLEKYGRRETLPPMFIAHLPVSTEAWERFTGENSEWSAENRETLIARSLAGEDYLVPLDDPAYPAPAAPGISWHAAKAYCAWLNTKLPPSLSGFELKIPSETEWEYAMLRSELTAGLLWEWCDDLFAPLDFFPAFFTIDEETTAAFEKAGRAADSYPLDRLLRGGSWINTPGSTGIKSRGALPPETSSPFVGFRPVIVPKRGN